MHENAVQMI